MTSMAVKAYPVKDRRLREVTLALAIELVAMAGLSADPAAALDSGRAAEIFGRMVSALGGPADFIESMDSHLDPAPIVRDIMLEAVERRFGTYRAPAVIEMLSDNGSPYIAKDTQIFARQLGLKPCFTPVQSPQSNGISEAFVKTLKQRYSMSYNARHTRTGTLWEERFKSVLVENGENAKAAVAAYIDLNPVRAKIVADPKDYRWSGYGEACGGGRAAREGLIAVHDSRGYEQKGAWRLVSARYRTLLYVAGGERREAYTERVVRSGIKTREVDRVVGSGGKMTLQEALRCRVRYFTDGMAIGGEPTTLEVELAQRYGSPAGPLAEGDYVIILIDNGSRDLIGDDLTEDTIRHTASFQLRVVSMESSLSGSICPSKTLTFC